jgi:hypothetical protein
MEGRIMQKIYLIASGLALLFGGCGAEKGDSAQSEAMAASHKMARESVAQGKWVADKALVGLEGMNPRMPGVAGDMGPPANAAQAGMPPAVPAEPLPRKIIRAADIKVIVADFGQTERELKKLLGAHKDAYVAKAEINGSPGAPRSGQWTIRVPVAEFDSFIDALLKLGIPQRNSIDSKDVTEEFYDVQTRVKNKKVEEDRLVKHLEKSTGKLDEILKVEAEISRVRGEIEQMEGRLRFLANLSELTTIHLQIQEIKDYVPPQAPTFTSNIASTFTNSYDLLVAFGKNLVLLGVALSPWLPLVAIIVIPSWYFIRKQARTTHRPA